MAYFPLAHWRLFTVTAQCDWDLDNRPLASVRRSSLTVGNQGPLRENTNCQPGAWWLDQLLVERGVH